MVTPRDIEWAAGFLEGEGSFASDREHLNVQASQVQRWPLDRLQQIVGGTIYEVHRTGKNDYWRWRSCGIRAAGIMMTVFGLMSPRRKRQILAGLTVWRSKPALARYRTSCLRGHLYTSETLLTKNGWRRCRACDYVRDQRRTSRSDRAAHKSRVLSAELKGQLRQEASA